MSLMKGSLRQTSPIFRCCSAYVCDFLRRSMTVKKDFRMKEIYDLNNEHLLIKLIPYMSNEQRKIELKYLRLSVCIIISSA